MRIFRNLFVLFFSPVGIFMLPLVSCEHKELCYDHSHTVDVRVVLDWKNAAEASPSSMRLYLFPQDGGGGSFVRICRLSWWKYHCTHRLLQDLVSE